MKPRHLLPGLLLVSACGSAAGTARGGGNGDEATLLAEERSYLATRREERSCEELRTLAETEFANQNHAGALEVAELLMAFCPNGSLTAIEKTLVILARPEALASKSAGRSVRVRLALPLPSGDRLFWFAAYADRKLGLNNLTLGQHRIDVELHLWRPGQYEREGQMLRASGGIDVRIDGRMPVWVDVTLNSQGTNFLPLELVLRPASTHFPPGVDARSSAEGIRRIAALRDEMPPARTPASLDRAGLPASIDLELCFDERGQVRRVDPLGWSHPRHLGTYLEGLRDWRLPAREPSKSWFCTAWRQSMTPMTRTRPAQ
jgi:hypothetical protein